MGVLSGSQHGVVYQVHDGLRHLIISIILLGSLIVNNVMADSIVLRPGLNLVGIAVDNNIIPDTFSLIEQLGTPDTIDKLQRFNPTSQVFENTQFDNANNASGSNTSLQQGEGWLVFAKTVSTLTFDAASNCANITLQPGLNVVGMACLPVITTAYQLLQTIGDAAVISSIQSYNLASGRFLTVAYDSNGVPSGQDFAIEQFKAYLVHMHDGVTVDLFEVDSKPKVNNFSPKTATVGDLITLVGNNFAASVPAIRLNATNDSEIEAQLATLSANAISFVVPPGTVSGPIQLDYGSQLITTGDTLSIIASQAFGISITSLQSNVMVGESSVIAVSLTSASQFDQLADLSISSLPTGVLTSFTPNKISLGQVAKLEIIVPSDASIGGSTLTISASAIVDGINLVETANFTLVVEPITTTFRGQTVVNDPQQTPLGGVTVSFIGRDAEGNDTGCYASTVADAAGNFVLNNLPEACYGEQLIRYDGLTASTTGQYAGVDLRYNIQPNQVTVSPVLVHLPRIDNAETIDVIQNHSEDQHLVFETIPNLETTVYAGTTFTLPDGSQPDPFPLIAIDIPIDRLPEEMPPNSESFGPFIVAFQPANTVASQPVAVFFPNISEVPASTPVTLMTLDPTQGIMVPYGTGVVSSDGRQIIPDFDPAYPGNRYGLVHFDWHGPLVPPNPNIPPAPLAYCERGNPADPTVSKGCQAGNTPKKGDPVELASGMLSIKTTDITINSSRGLTAEVRRVYRTEFDDVGPFGIGASHNYDYFLDTNRPQSADAVNLLLPDGTRYRLTDPNPITEQPSGTAYIILVNLAQPSMRGAELKPYANGTADLVWRNGTIYHFTPVSTRLGSVLSAITDRNGNTTQIKRSTSVPRNVTEVIDPTGRKLKFAYDTSNRISRITDPLGHEVSYLYNAQGALESVTDPENQVTTYRYDTSNRITKIINARGITVAENTYDENGRVIKQKQANGGILQFDYELMNPAIPTSPVIKTVFTNAKGQQTIYRFNNQGFVTDVTDALGQTRLFDRQPGTNMLLGLRGNGLCDICGNPQTGPISYTYDRRGNRLSITDALNNQTRFTYHGRFNTVATMTDPLGNATRFEYDSQGNLIKTINARGSETSVTYNVHGLPIKATDPVESSVTIAYDSFANPVLLTDHLGRQTRTRYDGLARPVEVINPLGRRSITQYDKLGRVTATLDAQNNRTNFSYNAIGQLLSLTDARNNSTTYEYADMGYLAKRTDTLANFDQREYDLNGNLIRYTDRRGQTTLYHYDVLDRLTQVDYQDGSFVTYRYDARNRLVAVNDSVGGINTFNYDAIGRAIRTMGPTGSVEYTYDARGAIASRTVVGQSTVTYDYDNVGNLLSAAMPEAALSFDYDIRGLMETITRSNEVSTQYLYNSLSQLTKITHQTGNTIINEQTYSLDATGNRILNQTSLAQPLTTQAVTTTIDQNSNRLLQHGSITYTYDNNGNRLTAADASGTTHYTWDTRNRLEAITKPDGEVIRFRYDFAGNLIEQNRTKDGATNTENYVLDLQTNVVLQSNNKGEQISILTAGGIDTHLAAIRNDGQVDFGLRDGINSTIATTDLAGNVKDTFFYEPFGETTATSNDYPFQYTGRTPVDDDLYYYRARFYDPRVGRFISQDPIGFAGGDVNLYGYVGNGVVSNIDPTGLVVELRCRPAKIVGGLVDHCWLKTDTKEAGMSSKAGACSAGDEYEFLWITPVYVTDHSCDSAFTSKVITNVDEECVNRELELGKDLGTFGLTNNCQSFADNTLWKCRAKKDSWYDMMMHGIKY